MAVTEDSLAALAPRAPTADPFADSWYAYLHDPAFGYVKVAFLTYLDGPTTGDRQHGFVHVAVAPRDGGARQVDLFLRDVVSEPVPHRAPGAFRFEADGVRIDERSIVVDRPEVAVEVELTGPLHPYFPEPHPAASPFVGPTGSLPSEQSHWFVVTLGTPATYRYRDDAVASEGDGLLYLERGWSIRQAQGFAYVMATGAEAKVVLTCGMPDATTEVWAGRCVTRGADLTFLPFAGELTVERALDPAAARAEVTLTQGGDRLHLVSTAPPRAFHDSLTPSQTVFRADRPVAKTMDAAVAIEVRRDGDLVDRVELPQSILEFGGALYPG